MPHKIDPEDHVRADRYVKTVFRKPLDRSGVTSQALRTRGHRNLKSRDTGPYYKSNVRDRRLDWQRCVQLVVLEPVFYFQECDPPSENFFTDSFS